MKALAKSKRVLAALLAVMLFASSFAFLGVRRASALTYGAELVANGSFDAYANSFGKPVEEEVPSSPVPMASGAYEDRTFDCYNTATLNGGRGQYVKTEQGDTYARLYYDGAATNDSMDMWVQPGWLPAGTYTITADVELIGFSTGDCFALKYNGGEDIKKEVFNAAEYEQLPDSDIDGLKKVEVQFTLAEGNEFPASMFWLYHKNTEGIEAHIYRITYRDAEDNVVYENDFSAPFAATARRDMPYGQYEDRDWGGIYCMTPSLETDPFGGYGQVVRERRADGTTDTYARLYDNDKISTKDTMNFWIQPGTIEAGDYTVTFDFEIQGNNAAQYCEFNVDNTSEGRKTVKIENGQALSALPKTENGLRRVSIDYTLDTVQQFNALNIWFWHGNDSVRELHLYDVRIVDRDTQETVYENDFSAAFNVDPNRTEVGDSFGFNDAAGAAVVKEADGNIALEMAGTSAFNTLLDVDGPAKYAVEFDVKPSQDYAGTLSFFFAAPDAVYNSATTRVAAKKSDFDFLDEAERDGYYRYTTSVLVNNFMEPHILSLYTMFSGEGGTVTIDNISVRKIEGSVTKQTTPSTEGLVYTDLVLGGDFEYLNEGYTFVPLPDDSTYFWGSAEFDSPGKIVSLDGNKVLQIAYDPAKGEGKQWASAFVFLDPEEFNTEDVFTLSYRYKYEGKEGFDPGIGFQTTFIGATGIEHCVQYLNYLDDLKETSGVNTNEWPFTAVTGEDGWTTVTLTFRMDSSFLGQVDSIRFLNYNNCQEEIKLYIDDVKFGKWTAEAPAPDGDGTTTGDNNGGTDDGTEKGCGGCGGFAVGGSALLGGAVVCGTGGLLAVRRKRK